MDALNFLRELLCFILRLYCYLDRSKCLVALMGKVRWPEAVFKRGILSESRLRVKRYFAKFAAEV